MAFAEAADNQHIGKISRIKESGMRVPAVVLLISSLATSSIAHEQTDRSGARARTEGREVAAPSALTF